MRVFLLVGQSQLRSIPLLLLLQSATLRSPVLRPLPLRFIPAQPHLLRLMLHSQKVPSTHLLSFLVLLLFPPAKQPFPALLLVQPRYTPLLPLLLSAKQRCPPLALSPSLFTL